MQLMCHSKIREDVPERRSKVDKLGFFLGQTSPDNEFDERLIKYAQAVELGRAVGRDIGGGDPERMAPPRVAEYVQELFNKSSNVKVEVVKDKKNSKKIFHYLLLLTEQQAAWIVIRVV